jgi:hypothetical protein
MKQFFKFSSILLLALSMTAFTGCSGPQQLSSRDEYYQPAWAPPHYPGARYYYFPDIEVYYDMEYEDYVYLNNGQWLFSSSFPSMYSSYDPYSGFVITLNLNVYQPWLHHQYYVAHYPRYYYHNVYRQDRDRIRGFNENDRKPFYWNPGERDRAREFRNNPQPPRAPKQIRRDPQDTRYHGRPVGEPVKVKPVMRKVKEDVQQRNEPRQGGQQQPKQQGVPKKKGRG